MKYINKYNRFLFFSLSLHMVIIPCLGTIGSQAVHSGLKQNGAFCKGFNFIICTCRATFKRFFYSNLENDLHFLSEGKIAKSHLSKTNKYDGTIINALWCKCLICLVPFLFRSHSKNFFLVFFELSAPLFCQRCFKILLRHLCEEALPVHIYIFTLIAFYLYSSVPI